MTESSAIEQSGPWNEDKYVARFLWTQKQDIGPMPRIGHAMTYDANRGRIVLFGGNPLSSGLLNDTWEWDGENWTQMADMGPLARSGCAMAYDIERSRVVLFGGAADGLIVGDTWEWDGVDWTQVADSGPAPRVGHAIVYDSARDRVVMFGGASASLDVFRDTWQWNGVEWTQQEDTGPSARKAHALAYDRVRERITLFGGDDGTNRGLRDTWEWDGATWTQVSNFGPDPCFGAAMVFKGDKVALYGGIDSFRPGPPPPRVFGNTWEWDGKHWTQRQDIGPGPRWNHAMAYDSTRGCIVLFGGVPVFNPDGNPPLPPDRLLGDTWEHSEPLPTVALESLVLSPPLVSSQSPSTLVTGTITLTGPAPAGGSAVIVSVPAPLVPLPAVVVIPGGATVGQFEFTVSSVPFVGLPIVVELGASSKTFLLFPS